MLHCFTFRSKIHIFKWSVSIRATQLNTHSLSASSMQQLLFVQPHCLYLYRRLVDGDHRITQDNKNLDTFFCLISIFIRRFVNTTKTACQNFAFLSRKKTQKSDKNAPPYTKFFHQINIKCNSNKEDQLWKIPWTSCRSIHRITIFFNPCVHKNTNIPAAKPFLDNVGLENASESKMF